MKCLILAGGRGDRMWPLSRKNYPKQFIQVKNNHSIFQETVARNMAFCDEFIIAASTDYESIIENQMEAFEGITYRCIYEEIGRKTTTPIVLTSLSLPESELLFVVSSDHLISGENYKNNILEAKEKSKQGKLVTFGMDIVNPDVRFGYIKQKDGDIVKFSEKPDKQTALEYIKTGEHFINSGMFMFRVGDFLNELRKNSPYISSACNSVYYMKRVIGSKTYYDKEVLENIPAQAIEKSVFEATRLGYMIRGTFDWKDVGSLDDLTEVDFELDKEEQLISNKCENTTVINNCADKLVLVNHLKDVMVVNTEDAVYIGKKGEADDLKEIIRASKSMWGYFDKSRMFYHVWGEAKILEEDPKKGYQVRKITILPGKTIAPHSHKERWENWCITEGKAAVKIDKEEWEVSAGDSFNIPAGSVHMISCTGEKPAVFVETATGMDISSEDFVTVMGQIPSEAELGYDIDPFIKLAPAYKDYLWGGNKLNEIFGKKCEYDVVAESWELSAHPDGQSIVKSGRYKGLSFGEYLVKIGRDKIGWKFQNYDAFPLLIKLIDAKEDLSVQVHPGDDYALEHENEYGKSELWHIIDAEPGACIYMGFSRDVTRDEFLESLQNGRVLSLLNRVEVKAGEDYYIPAGTVHAVGKGMLICEVQQSSNSTYRLYDYDRVDKYGNKRRLDIDKALDVMDLKAYRGNEKCKYFDVKHIKCEGVYNLPMGEESFCAFMVLEGAGEITDETESLSLAKGDCVFIPKRPDPVKLLGNMEILTSKI